MNPLREISDRQLSDALRRRAVRMSGVKLDASARAYRLAAMIAASNSPEVPRTVSALPRRLKWRMVIPSAAAVAAVVVGALLFFSGPRSTDDDSAAPIIASVGLLDTPLPVKGAEAAVTSRPKSLRPPVQRRRKLTAATPVSTLSALSEHDRILAEIIAAETPETRAPELPVDDPRRRVAAIINSEIALNAERYTGYPIITLTPPYDHE